MEYTYIGSGHFITCCPGRCRPDNFQCNLWRKHYIDVIMGLTIVYSFIQTQIKENIKTPRHWPLCGEFTGDRWIPRTNGQLHEKCVHLMTSSCFVKITFSFQCTPLIWLDRKHPIAHPQEQGIGCYSAPSIYRGHFFKFHHCNCCAVCTGVSYITAIYRESIVYLFVTGEWVYSPHFSSSRSSRYWTVL